jgi:hypothetical protein
MEPKRCLDGLAEESSERASTCIISAPLRLGCTGCTAPSATRPFTEEKSHSSAWAPLKQLVQHVSCLVRVFQWVEVGPVQGDKAQRLEGRPEPINVHTLPRKRSL